MTTRYERVYSDAEITERLTGDLARWSHADGALVRVYRTKDWRATLLAAGAVAALAPADSLGWLMAGLALLGLGWNFGLVSGTALVVDGTTVANRARTQGSIDVLIALSGAGAGAGSGVVMASTSYAALSVAGGVLALGAIPVLWWVTRRGARGAIRRGERTGSHRGT